MAVQTLQANTLQYAQDITLEGDWEVLGTIPTKVRIQVNNGSITAQKTNDDVSIVAPNGDIRIDEVGTSNTLEASGKIDAGTISSFTKIKAGGAVNFQKADNGAPNIPMSIIGKSVNGKNAGEYATITATNGNIILEKIGSSATIKASRDIQLGTVGSFTKVTAGGAITFEKAENGTPNMPLSFVGASVTGKTIGDYATITATNGNIILEKIGSSATIKASHDIQLGTVGSFAKVTAGGAITFEKAGNGTPNIPLSFVGASVTGKTIGDYATINASNGDIDLEKVGSSATIEATGNIKFDSVGSFSTATARGAIEFDKIGNGADGMPMSLRGKTVSGRAAGDYATIIADGGDIRLEKMGSGGTLNASGNIELGTAGGFLKAQAGKIIRYERAGTNPTFDSLDQIVRPWAEAPPAPPPPVATRPTTIINEAEIVAAQRKAAKDRGEGI